MLECESQDVPLASDFKIQLDELTTEDKEEMLHKPYRNLIAALLWLSRGTHPDISAGIGILSRFSHNPSPRHWNALLGVLKYLKGTMNLGIQYYAKSGEYSWTPHKFYCYTDASFSNDLEDGKSTSGYIVYQNGGPVSWYSKSQDYTVQSTMESEYMAAGKGAMELEFLGELLKIMFGIGNVSKLLVDNTACIYTIKNAVIGEKN
jgi:hypothetical protein